MQEDLGGRLIAEVTFGHIWPVEGSSSPCAFFTAHSLFLIKLIDIKRPLRRVVQYVRMLFFYLTWIQCDVSK